jgi:hypothetical protein
LLHIVPREIDDLRVVDFFALCQWVDDYQSQMTKGAD